MQKNRKFSMQLLQHIMVFYQWKLLSCLNYNNRGQGLTAHYGIIVMEYSELA